MLRTLDCEGVLFGCRTVEEEAGAAHAAPGAAHLLGRLPADRWGLVTSATVTEATDHLLAADLPQPGALCAFGAEPAAATFTAAAQALGADPYFCLALVEHPDHVDAALDAGMKVIGLSTHHAPAALADADLVVPSLRSLHVVGTHPVLVLEVDALPDIGTFNPGRFGRR